jgi:hypothetical protein
MILLLGFAVPLLAITAGQPATQAARAPLPSIISLPPGFQPEGIAVGPGPRLYVGHFRNGSVLAVDPRTGGSEVLVPPSVGRGALGLALEPRTNILFVAGGGSGHGFAYDSVTGTMIADYAFASGTTFVNGVVVTRDDVWFTDSVQPVLYKIPLGRGGRLPPQSAVQTIALGADFPAIPRAYNANGIVASDDGKVLIVVHTTLGRLFRVDVDTGIASAIDLGGESVPNGDGLVLRGRTLFVVQNFSNQVAVVHLGPGFDRGSIDRTISDPRFDIITSGALASHGLYVTNARYTTPYTPETIYSVVRVERGRDGDLDCDSP